MVALLKKMPIQRPAAVSAASRPPDANSQALPSNRSLGLIPDAAADMLDELGLTVTSEMLEKAEMAWEPPTMVTILRQHLLFDTSPFVNRAKGGAGGLEAGLSNNRPFGNSPPQKFNGAEPLLYSNGFCQWGNTNNQHAIPESEPQCRL